ASMESYLNTEEFIDASARNLESKLQPLAVLYSIADEYVPDYVGKKALAERQDSWGWKRILNLRNMVERHIRFKVGNGKSVNVLHDKWSNEWSLASKISKKEIFFAGFKDDNCIADLINDSNNPDKPIWVDNKGNCKNYSTANVWRDIRGNEAKVVWKDIVWHAHCIPKHTFILWLAVKGKLSTQDKMSKWYPNKVFECSLCQNEADSHEHLFFKCEYAQRVWKKVCIIARINIKDEQWEEEIIKAMSLGYKKKNLLGIISRLCFAAVVYYIWQERNWRLFNNLKFLKPSMMKLEQD
ncbi:RNA-directed DNA polymerase, eukaryota, reverse transcriptase zinc-binding domain protein, partial [Tanacetum coccineum]